MAIDPLIPVYLNQRMVFDLTAMLEGGIATVSTVQTSDRLQKDTEGEVSGNFGLASALASLIKIDFAGRARRASSSGSEMNVSEDRVHTPASLFGRLRDRLRDEGLVNEFPAKNASLEPGQVVEFRCSVRRNPVTRAMETFASLMDIAIQFTAPISAPAQPKKGQRSGQQSSSKELREAKQTRAQIDALLAALTAGRTADVIGSIADSTWRALITLEGDFLNDPTMADLVDGQFRVLGKVVNVVVDSSGSISLLRHTALSAVKAGLLGELLGHLEEIGKTGELEVPDLEWNLTGPLVHVLPIAVFA